MGLPDLFNQDAYKAVKAKYVLAIEESAAHPEDRVSVPGVHSLGSQIAQGIDEILATRLLEGTCQVCRNY
jgi:hypothetical protein